MAFDRLIGEDDVVAACRLSGGFGSEFERVAVDVDGHLDVVAVELIVADDGRTDEVFRVDETAVGLKVVVAVVFVLHEVFDRLRLHLAALVPIDVGFVRKEVGDGRLVQTARVAFLDVHRLAVRCIFAVAVIEDASANADNKAYGLRTVAGQISVGDASQRDHIHRRAVLDADFAHLHVARHIEVGDIRGAAADRIVGVIVHLFEVGVGEIEQICRCRLDRFVGREFRRGRCDLSAVDRGHALDRSLFGHSAEVVAVEVDGGSVGVNVAVAADETERESHEYRKHRNDLCGERKKFSVFCHNASFVTSIFDVDSIIRHIKARGQTILFD